MKNLILFAALLAACGGHNETTQQPTTPPPASTADQPKPVAAAGAIASDDDYMAKGTDLMNKMITIGKEDGTDCDKLALDLDKIRVEAQPLVEYEKAHPDAKSKFAQKMESRQNEVLGALGPGMNACKDNDKMKAVMSKE